MFFCRRFVSHLVIISFFLQTLYPSVAFAILMVDARVDRSLGRRGQLRLKIVEYDGSGDDLSFHHGGLPETGLSDGGASDVGSSAASTSPYGLPIGGGSKKSSGLLRSFGAASVVDQSVPPSPLTSAASTSGISDTDAEGSVRDFPADLSDTESVVSGVPSDRSVHTTASQAAARVLIERHIDLADQSVLRGSCLYHDLTRQEDNLLWSYKGLSIVMGHDGGVVVSGTFQDKDSALSISGSSVRLVDTILSRLSVKTPEFFLVGDTKVQHLSTQGDTLIQADRKHTLTTLTSTDGIATLQGEFTLSELNGSIRNRSSLSFQGGQGNLTNEGDLTLQDNGSYQGTVTNQKALNLKTATITGYLENTKDGVVTVEESLNADTIKNAGQIQGEDYQLEAQTLHNTGTLLGEKKIVLQTETLTQHGRVQAPVMDLRGVQQIIDTKDSVWTGETLLTQLHQDWTVQGSVGVDSWLDDSEDLVVIQNVGKIITRKQASFASQFKNAKGGTADLTGVAFGNRFDQTQLLVNEGEMILRRVQSLGGTRRVVHNLAGAKLLFLDCGYRTGRDHSGASSTRSLALDKSAVSETEGLHFGTVTNSGTIGFGGGSYTIHGAFNNEAGGFQEILAGQDLAQEDFVNDGEVGALQDYRIDQSQGVFTKLGKVLVKGKATTKISERALRQKTGGTTWRHTGHLDMGEWVDESDSGVTIANAGTLISRRQTTITAAFENLKAGIADLTEVAFNNFRDRCRHLYNQGNLILRRIRSLGQDRRDILNAEGAKFTLLDCGYRYEYDGKKIGGLDLGKIDNYGTIGFGSGDYYTQVFTNHKVEEVLPGYHVHSDDFINHGVTKVHTKHFLIDQTRGVFTKLGKIEAPHGGVRLLFSDKINAADYIQTLPLNEWQLKDSLTIWAPIFHNTRDLGLGYPLELLVASFTNNATLHSFGLNLKARTFAQGNLGGLLGDIKSSRGLSIEVEGDINNSRGRIESSYEGEVISTHGDIYVGQGIGGPTRQKNGAFIYSARGLKMKARNIRVSFGEVGSKRDLELQFLSQLVLESATVRSRGKTTFRGKSAIITRTTPYQNCEDVCNWTFWHNQWRHRDGGEASQVLVGDDLAFLVDALTISGSHVTAMGDITDKDGIKRTRDNLGYFVVQAMPYYQNSDKRPGDSIPDHRHHPYDWRHSTFNASGQVELTFSQYQLAALAMMAAGINLQGDYFALGSNAPVGARSFVPTTGLLSLSPALMSLVGGITQYRTPQQNPHAVYGTGSFSSTLIDPALLTLMRDSMTTAAFMTNPVGDPIAAMRHIRHLTDEEGVIQALQLTLTAAIGKGYLFPKKGAAEHIRLLLNNARTQAKGGRVITSEAVNQSTVPLLTAKEQTTETGEQALGFSLFIPSDYATSHLFDTSRGTLVAETDGVAIDMTKFLGVTGGVIAANKQDIDLRSYGDMALSGAAERYRQQGHNYQDAKVGGAFYAPEGQLRATTAANLSRQAIHVQTEKGAKFKAGGHGIDAALPLYTHQVIPQVDGETVINKTTNAVSTYRLGQGDLEEEFAGTLDTYAQDVEARGAITKASRVIEHAVHDTNHTTTTTKEDGGVLGGSTEITEQRHSSMAKGSVFKLTNPRVITATCGSIILEGITYLLPKVILNAPHGSIQLLARRNVDQYSRSETESSAVWTSVTQDSAFNVTHTPCQFSKDCIIETHTAESVLVEAVQGKTIEWIRRIELNGGTLTQRDLIDLHLSEHFEAEGPTAALGLVVALAVTIATSGAGASLGATVAGVQAGVTATTAQAFVIGATQAAFTTVCSQAANAILTHQGNVGKAAQALVSSDSLKSIAIAAGSAGLGRTIGSIPTRIAIGLARGEKPGHILTGVVVDQVAKVLATRIGQGRLSYVPHKVAHLALGASIGAVSGAVAGTDVGQAVWTAGLGAVVSEVMADAMINPDELGQRAVTKATAEGLPMTEESLTELVKQDARGSIDLSRLSAGVVAMFSGQDVDLAVKTATNAVEHNCLGAAVQGALKSPAVRGALEAAKRFVVEEGPGLLRKVADGVDKVAKAAKVIGDAAEKPTGGGGGSTPPPDGPDDKSGEYKRGHEPKKAPDDLPGFPSAAKVESKNSIKGGGGLRRRWESKDKVYEWDSRHGTVERYSKATGKHEGEFRTTGEQLKAANATRRLRD